MSFYMQQRYYGPVAGRFQSLDPMRTDTETGKQFGRYTYVENNPYSRIDPDGMKSIDEFIDQNAKAAANRGEKLVTFAWSFAGVAWKAFGAEGISQIADKGFGGATGADKLSAGLELLAAVPGGRLLGEAAKESGVLVNAIRGQASEARVLQELGLTKNTTAVSAAEGRSIPDALTNSLPVEIKDAANVSLTRQLRIQTDAAHATGRDSVLITGERTCVSGRCAEAFDQATS